MSSGRRHSTSPTRSGSSIAAIDASRTGRWRPSFGALFVGVVVLAALLIGSRPLGDNSFLTHLATGRLILDEGRVPRADPYSFTANGSPWVVQSWLASVVYAGVERLGGGLGLRLLHLAFTAALALIVCRLTRSADGVITRFALAALVLAVGAELWDERPLMFGLIFLGIYLVACEQLIPGPAIALMAWLWANTHGSFPLGLVAVSLLAAGRRLDGEPPKPELQVLRWALLGTFLAVVGPLGLNVLRFPLDLLSSQDVLENVVEWQSPAFEATGERAFILLAVVTMASLVRRPRWRTMLPASIFIAAGVLALRNLTAASLVLATCASPGLAGIGSIRSGKVIRHGWLAVIGMVVIGGLVVGTRLSGPSYQIDQMYPISSIARLEADHVDLQAHKLVAPDIVGNLLTSIYSSAGVVYFDDRFDMYPTRIAHGYLKLLQGRPGWRAELERVAADIVVWQRQQPLGQFLTLSDGWRVVALTEEWSLFCRRGSGLTELGC